MKTLKVTIKRCGECAPCQEWMMEPGSAPECARLVVVLPDGSKQTCGTDRKAYRAIQEWFEEHASRTVFYTSTIVWENGSCPPPVLRRPGRPISYNPPNHRAHPHGGYAQYGCRCVGCVT